MTSKETARRRWPAIRFRTSEILGFGESDYEFALKLDDADAKARERSKREAELGEVWDAIHRLESLLTMGRRQHDH